MITVTGRNVANAAGLSTKLTVHRECSATGTPSAAAMRLGSRTRTGRSSSRMVAWRIDSIAAPAPASADKMRDKFSVTSCVSAIFDLVGWLLADGEGSRFPSGTAINHKYKMTPAAVRRLTLGRRFFAVAPPRRGGRG